VYLGPCSQTAAIKLSLHRSGPLAHGVDRAIREVPWLSDDVDRLLTRWEPPDEARPGWRNAATILLTSESVAQQPPRESGLVKVAFLPPPDLDCGLWFRIQIGQTCSEAKSVLAMHQAGKQTSQAPGNPNNRTSEGFSHGFWASGWIGQGGPIATKESRPGVDVGGVVVVAPAHHCQVPQLHPAVGKRSIRQRSTRAAARREVGLPVRIPCSHRRDLRIRAKSVHETYIDTVNRQHRRSYQ
jgi:hypothetical protein